jgi:hypothetical protein
MLHMLKLAVGARDVAQLAEFQQARLQTNPPLRHQTRNTPRRADEITAGGSMFWVVAGIILVRQRITAILPDKWEDGTSCASLLLDPELVRVASRAVKPFQGWRYLNAADAPADLAAGPASGIETLPEVMRAALTELALL